MGSIFLLGVACGELVLLGRVLGFLWVPGWFGPGGGEVGGKGGGGRAHGVSMVSFESW